MKILIDVNLSPSWTAIFGDRAIESIHWTTVGDARATDSEILEWARHNGYVVFTNDLDFTTILALTKASGPSVIQVRAQNVAPNHLQTTVLRVLEDHASAIEAGAVVMIDESRSRIRILPLRVDTFLRARARHPLREIPSS